MGGIISSTVIHPLRPCSFVGPVPGTGAALVDEDGRDVAPGTVGELAMRRPTIGLTRGLWENRDGYLDTYWNVIPGLWVHGDFAYTDADEFWFITGRSDDTLKIAGKRTGPAEIEEILLAGGRLAAAAAIGAPDLVKGTAIVCVCVPADADADEAELRDALVDAVVRGLGAPYRPKDVMFVSALPLT
jgi:acetyl-CoA synthetase